MAVLSRVTRERSDLPQWQQGVLMITVKEWGCRNQENLEEIQAQDCGWSGRT